MAVYKFSNVSGFKNYQQYNDFLAGNPAVILDNGAYFPLGEFTLASSQANVEFTNIPQTYTHLQIRAILKNTETTNTYQALRMQFNGITTSVYSSHYLIGGGVNASSGALASKTSMELIGYVPSSGSSYTNVFGSVIIDILDYKNPDKFTTIRSLGGFDRNGDGVIGFFSGLYQQTTAVSSIKIYDELDNLAQFSQFALYGVLA